MELRFENIKEFAEHKKINKAIYQNMTYIEKRQLKERLYSTIQEKEYQKDIIWEYLNEPMDSPEFVYTSLVLNSIKRRK